MAQHRHGQEWLSETRPLHHLPTTGLGFWKTPLEPIRYRQYQARQTTGKEDYSPTDPSIAVLNGSNKISAAIEPEAAFLVQSRDVPSPNSWTKITHPSTKVHHQPNAEPCEADDPPVHAFPDQHKKTTNR